MTQTIAIIGAGPSGLMAADILSRNGYKVTVFDAMASPGRKFLRAGIGGLNLTKDEPFETFLAAYGNSQDWMRPLLEDFGPKDVRNWADGLGAETFAGSSGKVFPKVMKAAPLLRNWLSRLTQQGVQFAMRHQWEGWDAHGALVFQANEQIARHTMDYVVLALGGASWPRLGSTGTWTDHLRLRGITCTPWQPSNCGFTVAWSPFFQKKFAGSPLKTVEITFAGRTIRSPLIVSEYGIEGHGIYALSSQLRDTIQVQGRATIHVDLLPDRSVQQVSRRLTAPRGSKSLNTFLKKSLGLDGLQIALLHEDQRQPSDLSATDLALLIKAVPITCHCPRPIAEAISSAGGVSLSELDKNLQLTKLPNVFCAGEMLDWEAPTGGYLLTACLAQGVRAARGIMALRHNQK